MLWSIWLARNRKIFKDKNTATIIACNKAKNLALETIYVKTQSNIDATTYSVEERSFINYILDKNYSIQNANIVKEQRSQETHNWKIKLKEEEFANWLQKCNSYYPFFDGASKSNPGIAGAGGLISNAKGECILYYEWGLGNISNNRAEALVLYQGLIQLIRLGIRSAKVFGDSSVVISLMALKKKSPNALLQQIIQ